MATEIITREDLEAFGEKLMSQMKALLSGGTAEGEPRKWIKSYQVKNLLKISSNTLQTLRDNGTIPFTKIGGILFYIMRWMRFKKSCGVKYYPNVFV
ncbi:helix-turn-helix domain-containing protein [Mucilaginibacter terrae]|uniref:DNA-binding protein n=1 Tax=Mucilaginibacter terrae TaxID=1955052 RepID=A0ABU3GVI6_9SPHI|nr:helix-turn-helix domain-containing protein [Mucilaginibacter terrae]MDT3403784.1 hypothetical protein [Mucilaginibacter terrae]